MTTTLSLSDIATLDRQIESLNDYRPIVENEVKVLCEKAKEILQNENNV